MVMEEFKKKLYKMSGTKIGGVIVLFVLAIPFILFGLVINWATYDEFDAMTEGYAKLDVTYVMGPFASQGDEDSPSNQYFVAEATDGLWYVIDTGESNDLPVYGIDITDSDFDTLSVRKLYGKSTYMPSELVYYLVDYFSDSDVDLTESNYSDYFGLCYLDTTDTEWSGSIIFFMFGAVMVLTALIVLGVICNKRSKIKKTFTQLEQIGLMESIYSDFSMGQTVYSPKFKLAFSRHYLLDFSVKKEGFRIYPLKTIVNVFKCNMINGEPTTTSYIALETDSQRFCIAPTTVASKEYQSIIAQLKKNVLEGAII